MTWDLEVVTAGPGSPALAGSITTDEGVVSWNSGFHGAVEHLMENSEMGSNYSRRTRFSGHRVKLFREPLLGTRPARSATR